MRSWYATALAAAIVVTTVMGNNNWTITRPLDLTQSASADVLPPYCYGPQQADHTAECYRLYCEAYPGACTPQAPPAQQSSQPQPPQASNREDRSQEEDALRVPQGMRTRGRGEPRQIGARVVRQAGETRCMSVRALPTRWYSDEPDTRVLTRVEIVSNCERRQLVEVLVSPWPVETEPHTFNTPIINHMGSWYGWPNASMNDPPPPVDWNYMLASNAGSGVVHLPGQSFVDVLQEAADARVIEVQLASCDATRDGANGPEIKVLLLESYIGTDGFQRSACPVIPQRRMTEQERELLARIFNVPRPPANEDPQMTRCMNRDGALDLTSAETACRRLANDDHASPTLRGSALYNLARIRLIAGDFREAIEIGNQSLSMRPTANAHHNLGLAYLRQGDHAAAIGHFDAALRLDPQNRNTQRLRNRANLLIANPTLEQTWEAQDTRRQLIMAGMARIVAQRSRCSTEAAALPEAEGSGKSALMSATKLERLIAASTVDSVEVLRQRADQMRRTNAGLPQAARNYMACLLTPTETSAAQVSSGPRAYYRISWGIFLYDERGNLRAPGDSHPPTLAHSFIEQTRDNIARDRENLAFMTIHYPPGDDWRPTVAAVREMLLNLGLPANKIRARPYRFWSLEASYVPNCSHVNSFPDPSDRANMQREFGLTGCIE